MFAGAAREAVFSKADVIQRVNADFVPVALKAALVNRPPEDDEGLLYREISRSKPAPQGICVVNSAGKVLDWALMFDDDKSVLAFLDHAKQRFAKFPDAKKPVAAEVYVKFPSQQREDVADSGKKLPARDRHPEGQHCPAEPPLPEGTLAVRLVGRALGKDGKPVADTVRQEHYVEDRFNVTARTQEQLAKALDTTGKGPVKLPREVTRQWVKQAHLGVLDVQPLDNPVGSQGELKECRFVATKVGLGKGPTLWRVEGKSEVFIGEKMANAGPGDMHEIKLKWHGFIEMGGRRVTRLVLAAGGREKLKFQSARGKDEIEVAILPGGHRVDVECDVRFGIVGEAVAPAAAQDDVPEEARKHLSQALGGPFLVFRDKVQQELKLSREQKERLDEHLKERLPDAMQFFEGLGEKATKEREKELRAYREKAHENLAAVLKDTLKGGQRHRLWQLALQQEGLFALGNEAIGKQLKITDEQRKQFMAVVQQLQKKIEPLVKEAEKGGKPEEVRPRMMKVRKEHEGKIEALLSDEQKKKWKEMLGKALDLDD